MNGKRKFVLQKAYEISYAVFRIASRIGNAALREHLERQALSLLDAATVENYAWVRTVSGAVEYLMRFGGDVGLINDSNKETVLSELAAMDAVVAGTEKQTSAEPVPLDDIFSGQEPLFRRGRHEQHEQREPRERHEHHEPAEVVTVSAAIGGEGEPEGLATTGSHITPETRQSAILDRIRQSGNCRLRDLLEVLPDYSERTLRYDLQTLAEQNLIERIGNGGPAVFYRIRQPA